MSREERYFYLASLLALLSLPLLSYPFGLHTSLGFLAGTASGLLVVSYSRLLVTTFLHKRGKKFLFLSFLPRLAILCTLAFFLSLHQEEVSSLTFTLGFVIIIFAMLFSHLTKE